MMLSKLTQDYKDAMKNKQENRKIILNYVLAQIKNKKIELQRDLTNEEILALLRKETKSLSEAIGYLRQAGKTDELHDEEEKKALLESYLPQVMDREKTELVIKHMISTLWVKDIRRERWTLMKELMFKYSSQIDPMLVNEIITSML